MEASRPPDPGPRAPEPRRTPPSGPPARWVDTAGELEALGRRLRAVPRLALDTEANSLHAYRERTCLVQVSTDEESAIVDPLALPSLGPLRDALDRPDVEVVLHGGDYDITVLTRDHGFAFTRVFDTHLAATLLGEPRVGLADLVASAFGVRLDKRFQTADWAQRPLSAEHLTYLQNDTQHLLALRDLLGARLAAADLEEEAAIEFRRLAQRRGRPLATDPEGWRRVKGASALGPIQRAVLHELWRWREGEAERRDLPPFKVLGPQSLVAVAQHAREAADPHAALIGISPREAGRYGSAVRAAALRGLAAEREGRGPAEEERRSLTDAERRAIKVRTQRETVLRNWRRDEATARGVPNVVVLPNPALEWLAERGVVHPAELAAHPDVGPKRAARYGEAIAKALSAMLPPTDADAPEPPASG